MKALIFAAGIGSRLKPFTDCHPKALAPIGNQPAIAHVIKRLIDAGCNEIVVNVHHFASQIIDYISQAKAEYPSVSFKISDESDMLMDTGGGLLKASHLFDAVPGEPIILHNADIFTDAPLDEMLNTHLRNKADATLLVWERNSTRQLIFNREDRLCGWLNTTSGETVPEGANFPSPDYQPKAFGGIHIISADILPYLRQYAALHTGPFPIIPFYLAVMNTQLIQAFTPSAPFFWHDIGTPSKLAAANYESHLDTWH